MTSEEFAKELDTIITEANDKIVTLVHKAQADEGLNWDTNEKVSFHDDSNIERRTDDLACMGGWIRDRLNGINRLDKKSLTKKIRRALGYTYP